MSSSQALLLKRTDYREADLIVSVFTTDYGKVQALARGARNSRKRFGGALEPVHTLEVELDPPKRGDLFELKSSSIHVPRLNVALDLDRLQAAGKLLTWLRDALPERSREPELWRLASGTLDVLDAAKDVRPEVVVSAFGLQLLATLGWALDFENCVKCGKACPPTKPGAVSAARGGLVCYSCGGGKTRVDAALRLRLAETSQGALALLTEDSGLALRLVEEALATHANLT